MEKEERTKEKKMHTNEEGIEGIEVMKRSEKIERVSYVDSATAAAIFLAT